MILKKPNELLPIEIREKILDDLSFIDCLKLTEREKIVDKNFVLESLELLFDDINKQYEENVFLSKKENGSLEKELNDRFLDQKKKYLGSYSAADCTNASRRYYRNMYQWLEEGLKNNTLDDENLTKAAISFLCYEEEKDFIKQLFVLTINRFSEIPHRIIKKGSLIPGLIKHFLREKVHLMLSDEEWRLFLVYFLKIAKPDELILIKCREIPTYKWIEICRYSPLFPEISFEDGRNILSSSKPMSLGALCILSNPLIFNHLNQYFSEEETEKEIKELAFFVKRSELEHSKNNYFYWDFRNYDRPGKNSPRVRQNIFLMPPSVMNRLPESFSATLDESKLLEMNENEFRNKYQTLNLEIKSCMDEKSSAFKKQMNDLLFFAAFAKTPSERELTLACLNTIPKVLDSKSDADLLKEYFAIVNHLPGADNYEIYKFFGIAIFSIGIVLLLPVEIFFLCTAGLILGLPVREFFIPLASVIHIGLSLTHRPKQTLRIMLLVVEIAAIIAISHFTFGIGGALLIALMTTSGAGIGLVACGATLFAHRRAGLSEAAFNVGQTLKSPHLSMDEDW